MEAKYFCKFCCELGFTDEENTFESLESRQEHALRHLWTEAGMIHIRTIESAQNKSEFRRILALCFDWVPISFKNISVAVERLEIQQLLGNRNEELLQIPTRTKEVMIDRPSNWGKEDNHRGKKFTFAKNLENYKITLDRKKPQKKVLQHHIGLHKSKKKIEFECQQCERQCNTKSRLKDHMRIHTGEKPFKCTACAKSFTQAGTLKVHIARMHTPGEKPFKCEQCGKLFAISNDLKCHVLAHAGEYKCEQCDKCFSSSGHLKLHVRIHTGEKVQFHTKHYEFAKKANYSLSCNISLTDSIKQI